MRRLTMSILLSCLLTAWTASVTVAQSPSPPPWVDGRAEMTDLGFVVVVPDGWVAFDVTGDVDAQVTEAAALLHDAAFEASLADIAAGLQAVRQSGGLLVVMDPSRASSCLFGQLPGLAEDLDSATALMHASLTSDESLARVELPEVLKLPAGPTRLIAWGSSSRMQGVLYLVGHGGLWGISCQGDGPRADRWLSIAESFEFLPAEE
jgi:hypothetical protein